MPRPKLRLMLRLWPNGSVRPDAKPWANKDVFACFANASGINTHQFQPQPSPSLSLPLSTLLWNVLNLQSEAEVCLSDSLSIVYVPVYAHPSRSACSSLLCCCLCPCLCRCLCQARLLWRWVRRSLFLYILVVLAIRVACVNGARSSRSLTALQAHLHLHIVRRSHGENREGSPTEKRWQKLSQTLPSIRIEKGKLAELQVKTHF